jgi:ABC-2 type transport system permease protein
MSLRRSLTLARNDFDLLWRDPFAAIVLIAMPLVVMTFIKPAAALVLQHEGYRTANGSEQVVPGVAVMFVFFMVLFAGLAFFREHIWGTWDRIRSLPVTHAEIMVGKLVPPFAIIVVQQVLMFVIGYLAFGLRVRGSVVALIAVDASFAIWLAAFCVAVIAVCGTFQQVVAISNLGAIVFASIGGALTPIATLPAWAHFTAHGIPTYWAMRGFNSVLLDGKGLGAVLLPVGILLGAAVAFIALAALRFRFDTAKSGTL